MNRFSIAILMVVPVVLIAQAPPAASPTTPPKPGAAAAKKAAAKAKVSPSAVLRTPWGDPDLQGVWNDATSTPLQRPNGSISSKDVLSDEEAAEFQTQLASDLSRDRRDGGADADVNRA